LLEWSLDALAGCDPIVVALPADLVDRGRAMMGDRAGIVVVAGGADRQGSVATALTEVSAHAVVVHDAARPFLTPDLVGSVVEALGDWDAATAAVPIEDTIADVDGDVMVATMDRSRLWRIQTPQAFRTEMLKEAHRRASEDGFHGTHDAQLIERIGGRVAVVMGRPDNIKLTHAGDFEMAEAMIRARS
jgi:2-C-methyl-D-erythritol 4-phosphate cytidylyltransferase